MKKKFIGLVSIFIMSLIMLNTVSADELSNQAEVKEEKTNSTTEEKNKDKDEENTVSTTREKIETKHENIKADDKTNGDKINRIKDNESKLKVNKKETTLQKSESKKTKIKGLKNDLLEKRVKVKKVKKNVKVVNKNIYQCTDKELKMLACVVYLEAGNQPYNGKLAVANVVMNRVKNNHFPNTITKVIYQSVVRNGRTYYQFSLCKPGGALDKAMAIYGKRTGLAAKYEKDCLKAAKAALRGKTAFDRDYHFFMVYNNSIKRRKPDGARIAGSYFYNY